MINAYSQMSRSAHAARSATVRHFTVRAGECGAAGARSRRWVTRALTSLTLCHAFDDDVLATQVSGFAYKRGARNVSKSPACHPLRWRQPATHLRAVLTAVVMAIGRWCPRSGAQHRARKAIRNHRLRVSGQCLTEWRERSRFTPPFLRGARHLKKKQGFALWRHKASGNAQKSASDRSCAFVCRIRDQRLRDIDKLNTFSLSASHIGRQWNLPRCCRTIDLLTPTI